MYRFFVSPGNICGNDIYIDGPDVNHIKNVLRMKPGEEVSVYADDAGLISRDEEIHAGMSSKEYRCEIAAFEDDRVRLKLRFRTINKYPCHFQSHCMKLHRFLRERCCSRIKEWRAPEAKWRCFLFSYQNLRITY